MQITIVCLLSVIVLLLGYVCKLWMVLLSPREDDRLFIPEFDFQKRLRNRRSTPKDRAQKWIDEQTKG